MKRINFSVDFEDKELFEKSVREAIEAEAKSMAREAMSAVIKEEIARVTKGYLNDTYEYRCKIRECVNNYLNKHLDEIIPDADIKKMVDDKLDYRAATAVSRLDTAYGKEIDKKIDDIIAKKFIEIIAAGLTTGSKK